MFRALAAFGQSGPPRQSKKPEGFVSQSEFAANQSDLFTKQLAKTYITGLPTSSTNTPKDTLVNSKFGLGTWDPNTRQASLRDIDVAEYATSLDLSQDLVNADQRCKTATLDELLNTQNINDRLRCGWIYEKGSPTDQPKISAGALGTRQGPATFFTNPAGKWYWNLDDAKHDILADRCMALTDCKNVGATNYASCSWSTTRGTGIPVDQNGNALYPRDDRLSAPQSSLVSNSSQCPPPPPPNSPQAELARSRDICAPMANGRFSRDCILQQVTTAGCKMDGTLYNQLTNTATPGNYASGLANQISYQKYQQLAANPLLDSVVRDGTASIQTALTNFQKLASMSSEVKDSALNFAARDLCLSRGIMDKFDFCSELLDGSPAPFALECLQREFRLQGGQPAGKAYPTEVTKAQWDALRNWAGVKKAIAELAAATKSTNEKIQRESLQYFLGITRNAYTGLQIGKIPGVEVIWFNRGNNTFIGRRIQSDFVKFSTGGEVDGTGLYDYAEYYSITNLRPPTDQKIKMRLETDDGILYTLNKEANGVSTRGGYFDTPDSFGANWDQGPTQHNANKCWDLKGNGPNYVMGFWQETGGYAHSQIYYAPCNGGQYGTIPLDWLTLSQEYDAPMFSWQGMTDVNNNIGFAERRMPTVMGLDISSKTTVIETSDIPNIPAALKLRNNGAGFVASKRNIGGLSWRTMSVCFSLNSRIEQCSFDAAGYADMYDDLRKNVGTSTSALQAHWNSFGQREGRVPCGTKGAQILFNLGPLTLYVYNKQLIMKHNSIYGATYPMPLTIFDGKTPYYFVCNMRSDTNNQYPNRLTFAFGSVKDWAAGRVVFGQYGPNGISLTTTGNIPVVSPTSGDKLILGDPKGINSADANIYFARLFDYELDNADMLRDMKNNWQMAFV